MVIGLRLLSAAVMPSAALGFFLEFLGGQSQGRRTTRRVAIFSVVLGLGVAVTPLATSAWGRAVVAVWGFGTMLLSLSLLVRRVRRSDSKTERARLTYLAIGAAAALLFTALDGLVTLGLPFPTLGPVVTTLYLFFLAQTLLRLRLMDLHELLGKVASQTVLAVMLAAVFLVLTAWVKANTSLYLFNTVLAAFVIGILLEPLRAKVEAQVVHIFFRERSELLKALAALRTRLANVIDPGEATEVVLDALEETRRVTHASVYLLAEDRPGFQRLNFRGPEPVPFLDAAAARGLLSAASSGQKALLLENLERRIIEMRTRTAEGRRSREELKRGLDTRNALLAVKSAFTVPLVGGDRVVGFLNLWDERVPEAFASDEIAMVLELAERLATIVENSKLYERMRERDRLAALGEMAAGLAHEIRNPLGAIKGAAQCLAPEAPRGRGGRVPRRHRRRGEPPERRGDPVPRLRPAAEAELRHGGHQRGRGPHHPAHPERDSRPALAGDGARRGPAHRRRRSRAAQAGADQPGAERDPGAGDGSGHHPGPHPRTRAVRRSARLGRVRGDRRRPTTGRASPRSSSPTSSSPSSPPSRRARASGSPSASAS